MWGEWKTHIGVTTIAAVTLFFGETSSFILQENLMKRAREHADAVLFDATAGRLSVSVSVTHGTDAQRVVLEKAMLEAYNRALLLPSYAGTSEIDPVIKRVHVEAFNVEFEVRDRTVATLEAIELGSDAGMVILDSSGNSSLVDLGTSSSSNAFKIPLYTRDLVQDEKTGIVKESTENSCFNCGGPHIVTECSLAIDRIKVLRNKAVLRKSTGTLNRNVVVERNEEPKNRFVRGVLSERLRRALGMRNHDSEPPYFDTIRLFGKPPNVTLPGLQLSQEFDPRLYREFHLFVSENSVSEIVEARVILAALEEGQDLSTARVRPHRADGTGEWAPLTRELILPPLSRDDSKNREISLDDDDDDDDDDDL